MFKKDDVKSMAWTILLILFIRGFVVEPFKIPSGSMIPTLLVGDHLFVSKASYDLGIPFTNIKVVKIADPKRGDVVVFDYPNVENNPERDGIYYIKRIVGLPGDQISVKGGVPYFNEVPVPQEKLEGTPSPKVLPGFAFNTSNLLLNETLKESRGPHWVQRYPYRQPGPENIKALRIQTGKDCIDIGAAINSEVAAYTMLNEICSFTVPENSYFVLGDNRDDSEDGRAWGFVERNRLKGRALFIWMSFLQSNAAPVEGGPFLRWSRLGLGIK